MDPANKTDQSVSDFQTSIGAATHANLDMEQLISHTRTSLLDIGPSLQDSDGGIIPISEMHELHSEIHDILDSVAPNWVGNTANIVAFIFNFDSR